MAWQQLEQPPCWGSADLGLVGIWLGAAAAPPPAAHTHKHCIAQENAVSNIKIAAHTFLIKEKNSALNLAAAWKKFASRKSLKAAAGKRLRKAQSSLKYPLILAHLGLLMGNLK